MFKSTHYLDLSPPPSPQSPGIYDADTSTGGTTPTKSYRSASPFGCLIPREIISHILEFVDSKTALSSFAQASKTFQTESERILYRSLQLSTQSQLETCLSSLINDPRRRHAVRKLSFRYKPYSSQTLVRLLRGTLPKLIDVIDLDVRVGHSHNTHIFSGCAFKLKRFTTDVLINGYLTSFLSTQTCLVDLSLIHSGTRLTFFPDDLLPNLRILTAHHTVVTLLAPRRPLETIYVLGAVQMDDLRTLLPACHQTKAPLRELKIDLERCTTESLNLIAFQLPTLSFLRVHDCWQSVPSHENSTDPLIPESSLSDSFTHFKSLRHLVFTSSRKGSSLDDRTVHIALRSAWVKACPSLVYVAFRKDVDERGRWLESLGYTERHH